MVLKSSLSVAVVCKHKTTILEYDGGRAFRRTKAQMNLGRSTLFTFRCSMIVHISFMWGPIRLSSGKCILMTCWKSLKMREEKGVVKAVSRAVQVVKEVLAR